MATDLEALEATVIPTADVNIDELFREAKRRQDDERKRQTGLTQDQVTVLRIINENPFYKQIDRRRETGFSADKQSRLEKQLEDLGYVYHDANVQLEKGKGKGAKYLFLTDDGKKALGSHGIKPKTMHGSPIHWFHTLQLDKAYANAGYATDTDTKLGAYRPDVFCKNGPERGVVEVIHTAHAKDDLEKVVALNEHVDWIHLYFTDETNRDHYRKTLEQQQPTLLTKTDFRLVE